MRLENRKSLKYLVLGGDDRFIELANIYKRNHYDIALYGMDTANIKTIKHFDNLEEAVDKSDIIISPVPFAKDMTKLNTKYSKTEIEIVELLTKITEDKILLVGAINNYAKAAADKYKVNYIDYYTDESYQILNAIPTAEGTLSIIINETNTTVYGSNIMILGYGRIGKILSDDLKALGANVYTTARKESDLAWIRSKRMNAVPMDRLEEYLENMQIIINTIPAMILNQNLLNLVDKNVLLLDLASKPGGIDFEYADAKGLKNIHALGIPGKIAYKSAALYVFDTINKILDKL